MKYFILISCSFLLWISCNNKVDKNQTLISVALQNSQELDSMGIYGYLYENRVGLKDSAYISLKKVEHSGYYILDMGKEYFNFYYNTEDKHPEIYISADLNDFKNTFHFIGNSEKENQYLFQKKYHVDTLIENKPVLYAKNETDFMNALQNYKSTALRFLNQSNLNPDFKKIESKSIQYNIDQLMIDYEAYHKQVTKEENFTISDTLKNRISALNTDNNEDVVIYIDYRKLVFNDFYNTLYKDPKEGEDIAPKAIAYVNAKKSQNIKNLLLNDFIYLMSPSSKSNKSLYDEVITQSTDETTKKKITEVYHVIQKLEKGKPSPQFSYENFDGGTTSLSQLKGKYVYIDVWATWCGPCKMEIPFMKKLEEQLHGKNIQFVSISVDEVSDKDIWKKMVESEQLKGIQLFSDNAWNSKFIQDYRIMGIPRFILIDRNGNIIDADAKRPSDPQLLEQLKGLPNL